MSTAEPGTPPLAALEAGASCPNCGAVLQGEQGEWCGRCGQRNRHPRLDVKDLVHDAVDQVLGVDTKIGRTLRDFTLRPGTAARDYVRGARARYVNPLKYLIFALAAYFLMLAAMGLHVSDLAPMQPQLSPNPVAAELTKEVQSTLDQTMRSMLMAAPPIMAWVTGLLLGRRRYNFAECCSLWLFAIAHGTLALTIPAVLLSQLTGWAIPVWTIPFALAYYAWAARGFFERGWLLSVIGALAAFICFQLFLVGVLLLCVAVALFLSFGPLALG